MPNADGRFLGISVPKLPASMEKAERIVDEAEPIVAEAERRIAQAYEKATETRSDTSGVYWPE